MDKFEMLNINNKIVYITEKHHHNLLPWAIQRQTVQNGLIMLSLDHHTDTREPFTHYAFNLDNLGIDNKKVETILKQMTYNDLKSIDAGITNLRNDEHILTAFELGILNKAFIICYEGGEGDFPISKEKQDYSEQITENINKYIEGIVESKILPPIRPFTYPNSEYYIAENNCYPGCKNSSHDESCRIPHYNAAIESSFLIDKLDIFQEMAPGIVSNQKFIQNYFLDIDLDYFHTRKSINPQDPSKFHELIKFSEMITITKESKFIQEWVDLGYDKSLTVEYLLNQLLDHLRRGTSI